MRASVRIGPVEIGLVVPMGRLEETVARTLVGRLEPMRRPACVLRLEALRAPQPGADHLHVRGHPERQVTFEHPQFSGSATLGTVTPVRCAAHPAAVALLVNVAVAAVAPTVAAVVLRAGAVAVHGAAHLVVGPAHRSLVRFVAGAPDDGAVLLSSPLTLVHLAQRWTASALIDTDRPFGATGSVEVVWLTGERDGTRATVSEPARASEVVGAMLEILAVPEDAPALNAAAFGCIAEFAAAVPGAHLRGDGTKVNWDELAAGAQGLGLRRALLRATAPHLSVRSLASRVSFQEPVATPSRAGIGVSSDAPDRQRRRTPKPAG